MYIYYDAALSVLLPLSKWLREDPLLLVPSAMAEPSGEKKKKKRLIEPVTTAMKRSPSSSSSPAAL